MTFEEWQKVSDKKRKKKITKYLWVVNFIAKRIHQKLPEYSGIELEDIMIEGQTALSKEFKRIYDDKNLFNKLYKSTSDDITVGPFLLKKTFKIPNIVKDDTSTLKAIKGAMWDYVRSFDPVSSKDRAKIKKVKEYKRSYEDKNGHQPSEDDYLKDLKLSQKEVDKIISKDITITSYHESEDDDNKKSPSERLMYSVCKFESTLNLSDYIEVIRSNSRWAHERKSAKYTSDKMVSNEMLYELYDVIRKGLNNSSIKYNERMITELYLMNGYTYIELGKLMKMRSKSVQDIVEKVVKVFAVDILEYLND